VPQQQEARGCSVAAAVWQVRFLSCCAGTNASSKNGYKSWHTGSSFNELVLVELDVVADNRPACCALVLLSSNVGLDPLWLMSTACRFCLSVKLVREVSHGHQVGRAGCCGVQWLLWCLVGQLLWCAVAVSVARVQLLDVVLHGPAFLHLVGVCMYVHEALCACVGYAASACRWSHLSVAVPCHCCCCLLAILLHQPPKRCHTASSCTMRQPAHSKLGHAGTCRLCLLATPIAGCCLACFFPRVLGYHFDSSPAVVLVGVAVPLVLERRHRHLLVPSYTCTSAGCVSQRGAGTACIDCGCERSPDHLP